MTRCDRCRTSYHIHNTERGLSDQNEGPVVAQAQFLYAPPDLRRGEDEEDGGRRENSY